MPQVDIFSPPSVIDTAFWDFHTNNPQVYRKIVVLTKQAKDAGHRKIGMKMLFEVIRWEHLVHTRHDNFALNNNYTSRYVRLLADYHPELADMFEQRTLHS